MKSGREKGFKVSETTKKKMSESHKGLNTWSKGRKMLEKFKKKGKKSIWWKGGKYIQHGYIMIYSPKHPYCGKRGYIRKHRLVVEKYLGRYLTKIEVIHHQWN